MTVFKVKSFFLPVLCLLLFVTLIPENAHADLGWFDPTGATPMTFNSYATARPEGTPSSRPAPSTTPAPEDTDGLEFTRTDSKGAPMEKSILIIVENEIFTPTDRNVKNALLNYINYLMADYSQVTTYTWTGGFDVPGELRDLIASEYNTCYDAGHPLAGCIFIGDLPTAWYSMNDDIPDVESQSIDSEFPTDLFFMDLDGNWEMSVPGPGGLYYAHNTDGTGPGTDKEPEIWVSRIAPSYVNDLMDETELRNERISLIEQYFSKNIVYRQAVLDGIRIANFGARIYADQNNFQANTVLTELENVYAPGRVILHNTGTSGTDYVAKLGPATNVYEFFHTGFTSSANSHTFGLTDDGGTYSYDSYVVKDDINNVLDKQAIFYNVVGSSPARFVEDEYMANSYIFGDNTKGLVFIGSTKNGGMQYTKDFYIEFQNGGGLGDIGTVGECMRGWISDYITDESETEQERFCYGMTMIGDPTLKRSFDPAAQAIMSGIETLNDYLIEINSQPENSTNAGILSVKPSTVAMAVLALLNWDADETDTAVANGITYLLSRLSGTAADTMRYITGGRNCTYNTSTAILALAATHNSAYHDEIRAMRAYLMSIQRTNTNDSENYAAGEGGFGYGGAGFTSRADNSNSQFAIMGINIATWELYRELKVPAEITAEKNIPVYTYTQSLKWLNSLRNTTDPGSFYYAPSNHTPDARSPYTMTAASAWNYVLIHDGLQHVPAYIPDGLAAIEGFMDEALSWLSARNPFNLSTFSSNRYYYAFTIAKAISMSNKEAFFENWYNNLTSALINDMVAGHWTHQGSWGLPDAIETAFAIAALQVNKENPLTPSAKAFILNSHADLHVYDFRGNHTGYNKNILKVEEKVPGSRYLIRDKWNDNELVTYEFFRETEDAGEAHPTNPDLDPGQRFEQEIIIFNPLPGTYRIEMQGTSEGNFNLTIESLKKDEILESVSYPGTILTIVEDGETTYSTFATEDTVVNIVGGAPITAGVPQISPKMELDRAEAECIADAAPENNDTVDFDFTISETGNETELEIDRIKFINVFNDIDVTHTIFPEQVVVRNAADNSIFTHAVIPKNNDLDIHVEIPVPRGFEGPSSARLQIISNAGIQYINVTIQTNRPPVANAGDDQVVYAGSKGTPYAVATLDASGSSDPDGDILTYSWFENGTLLSHEMTFNYKFGTGVHTITLVVSDSLEQDSDEVIITVVEPVIGELSITPRNINRESRGRWVQATITLPEEIAPEDVNLNTVIKLRTPDGDFLNAKRQWIIDRSVKGNSDEDERCTIIDSRVKIYAKFDKSKLCDLIPVNGVVPLTVICSLNTGAYVNGTNTVLIKDPSVKSGYLGLWPFYIDRDTHFQTLTAWFTLPWGIRSEDMDPDAKAVLILPSGKTLEPETQIFSPPLKSGSNNENKDNTSRFHSKRKRITAYYSIARFLDKVPDNGSVKVYIQYTLKTGEIIYGIAYVTVFTR